MTKSDKIAEVFGFIEESPAQALADALAYEQYDRGERFEWSEPVKTAEQQLADALAYEGPSNLFQTAMEIEKQKAAAAMETLRLAQAMQVVGIVKAEAVYALVNNAWMSGIEG